MERKDFLGYPVDSLDIAEALSWMEERIRERIPSAISVINANKLWLMSSDKRLAWCVCNSDLIIPEWAVYWGAAKIGKDLKSPVYGVTLLKATLPWAQTKGFRPYFLGAKQEVIDALVEKIHLDYPNLSLAGVHHGYLKSEAENEQVLDLIRTAHPDILFVALGSPKQEYWIQENLGKISVPVALGVGGSFDVIAGLKQDTPAWARGHGLEWLYRLSQDPKAYWKRYAVTNPWFVSLVLREQLRLRFARAPKP